MTIFLLCIGLALFALAHALPGPTPSQVSFILAVVVFAVAAFTAWPGA